MIVFAVGEVEGRILSLYNKISHIEKERGIHCDWILCTGSFGVWPDYKWIDRSTRVNGDPGDFSSLYLNQWVAPRQTLFVSGPHEDHFWLHRQFLNKNTQVLGNVYHLVNGYQTSIGLNITGLGKVFSPRAYHKKIDYNRPHSKLWRYYTYNEVQNACSVGPTDILLCNQAPLGVNLNKKTSNAEGIKSVIYATRPKLVLHASMGVQTTYECLGSTVLSLNRDSIVPIEFNQDSFAFIT